MDRFSKKKDKQLDRFIPDRSAINYDYARAMLMEGKENPPASSPSPSTKAYRKHLAEALGMDLTTRILPINKPPAPSSSSSRQQDKATKPKRSIPPNPVRILDVPDLVDDFYLNLLDWGIGDVLAIALGNKVYLWHASNGSISELVTVDDRNGPITSVSWAPDGQQIAIGLNNSDVQLWDLTSRRRITTLNEGRSSRVGSLAWNDHILTTGGKDGLIINNDLRGGSILETYRGHEQEVCGLKWSPTGRQLASGGNDNLLFIWNKPMASSNSRTQWAHRLEGHTSAVKALAWSPFDSNLLASGGGKDDRCIKFWETRNGACKKSVDTGSQVCSLLWNKNENERELLSSHGSPQNQLTLWKYPSMDKMAELTGHTSRVLFMAQSPDGCTVASASAAAADGTLNFWNVFGDPQAPKRAPRASPEPFSQVIR